MFTAFERPDNLPMPLPTNSPENSIGRLQGGERLPTEHDLARQFSVSRNVVRESIARLKLNGLVETRPGRGHFCGWQCQWPSVRNHSRRLVGH